MTRLKAHSSKSGNRKEVTMTKEDSMSPSIEDIIRIIIETRLKMKLWFGLIINSWERGS